MTRIDRRALFSTGAAAALLAATGVSLDAAPKAGGTLRLAVPKDGSLDCVARGAMFDTLTEIAPDGTLRGELAQSWHSSDEARIWTFDLRADVMFHDGAPLRPEDVIQALTRLPDLASIETVADHQLRVELTNSTPGLPFTLADDAFCITRDQTIGTGCYRAVHLQEGRNFRGAKIKNHYKAGQAGWLNQIEVIMIPNANVRAEALRDGYVDVAALPAPSGLRERAKYRYHPSERDMALAVADTVGLPRQVSIRAALDDGRIAERWWMT
ncbi:ABC transporter substrate-binding protein [Tropicibacter sp. Alg240-R139]|uniref:ABC transporter substrate-binding protein n=1 Tax=Tropicibacter sp. Alg240-R139 TaxID=2305991 RepID=UPI0013DFF750|nr:ABC transporter substrate-binding protein [Tropicibacter sp. Alg240-R139]